MFVEGNKKIPLIMLCLFALLLATSKAVHEIWRDESFTWLLVKFATPAELFFSFVDIAHPPLWYALQWPLAKLGAPLESMIVLHFVIACAFAALLLFKSGLNRWLAILYLFSFQFFYAYGVLSRGYALMLLLLWTTGLLFPKRTERPRLYAASLALLLHTELWVTPLVAVLGIEFLLTLWKKAIPPRIAARPLLLLSASALIFAVCMWPPEHPSVFSMNHFYKPAEFLRHIGDGLLPPLSVLPFAPEVDGIAPIFTALQIIYACILFILCFYLCTKSRVAGAMFIASFAWIFYILAMRYEGYYWHSALIPSLLLFFYWFSGIAAHKAQRARAWFACLFGIAMLYGVGAAMLVLRSDAHYPYSGGKAMAQYIKNEKLTDRVLMLGHCTYLRSTVAYLPDTMPIYIIPQRRLSPIALETAELFPDCFTASEEFKLYMFKEYPAPGRLLLSSHSIDDSALILLHETSGLFGENNFLYALKQ